MDETQARLILQNYRPGLPNDPETAEALRMAAANPELGRWFADEQAFDRAIAAQIESVPAPFGLKTRILAEGGAKKAAGKARWIFGLAAFAALGFLSAELVSLWRAPAPVGSAEYAREMASFIQLAPPLPMESHDLGAIRNWLSDKNAPAAKVPARLAALDPIGCRVLSFRGHEVTLICFRREGNRLAHLFVVNRAAMPKLKMGDKPVFDNENGWMTATWMEDDQIYMIATQGGRTMIEKYLPNA
ncbi:MAG TPA: hypothetical protein VGG02_10265 [Chthoniobacterales bacterium]|jgi:hypothetical protein